MQVLAWGVGAPSVRTYLENDRPLVACLGDWDSRGEVGKGKCDGKKGGGKGGTPLTLMQTGRQGCAGEGYYYRELLTELYRDCIQVGRRPGKLSDRPNSIDREKITY